MKNNFKRVDMVEFDKFLDKELYLRPKVKRQVVITNYKRYLKLGKSIKDLEECLYDLDFDEITIGNISKYIINWNYRKEMNKRCVDEKKC